MSTLIDANKLARRIAGHSNYCGDDILCAIYCMSEGNYSDKPIKPLENKKRKQRLILDKIKQAREEIDTDVRIAVKHFTNTDAVIDYVLDTIDELIESEEIDL